MLKFIHPVDSAKGYSLYSRLVSSMLVWTPFPRGTCTPSKVTEALGSGAVLPRPAGRKKKKNEWKFEGELHYGILTEGIWVTNYSTTMPSCHSTYKLNIMHPVVEKKSSSPLTLCLPLGNFVMWDAFFNSCLHNKSYYIHNMFDDGWLDILWKPLVFTHMFPRATSASSRRPTGSDWDVWQ